MNWRRETAYNLRSDCGRYTVAKYMCRDEWKYEAWRGKTNLATRLDTAREARQVCEDDAESQV